MKAIPLIILLVAGVFIIQRIDTTLISYDKSIDMAELTEDTRLFASRLESTLETRIHATQYLGSLFTIHPNTGPMEFANFAENLFSYNPPLRALQFADNTTKVQYVYPPRGNEITISDPMLLIEDELRGDYVRKAIEKHVLTLQPPFTLRQGGLGIVARNPVFIDDEFYGLTIAVIDIQEIIETELQRTDRHLNIRITDSSGVSFYNQMDPEDSPEQMSIRIFVADQYFDIETSLQNPKSRESPLSHVLLWSSGLLILLLIQFILLMYLRRSRSLEAEIAQRSNATQEAEKRFEAIISNTGAGFFILDSDMRFLEANTAMLSHIEVNDEKELHGRDFMDFIDASERDAVRERLIQSEESTLAPMNFRIGTGGNRKYFTVSFRISRKRNGETLMEGFCLDISEIKQRELYYGTLLKEIHHRIKNNLNLITALLSLKEESLEFTADLSDIRSQIRAISMIHEKLYGSQSLNSVYAPDYFNDLVSAVLAEYAGPPIDLISSIAPVELETQIAMNLALIITEVAINSIKYAYGKQGDHSFTLNFSVTLAKYTLQMTNSGPPIADPLVVTNNSTLGFRLIHAICSQLGAVIHIDTKPHPQFTIELPIISE